MFQKGRQKTGGRKKGAKAKRKSLRQSLTAKGFDLGTELLALYKLTEPVREEDDDGRKIKVYYRGDFKMRFDILKLIAKYTQPPAPREEEELDDDDDDDEKDIIAALRASLNEADTETEEDSMESGGSSLEAAQSPADDLQADSSASKGPT